MTRLLTLSAVITLLVMHGNVAQAVTVQGPSDPNIIGGRNYLYVEAEDYVSLNDTDDIGDGFAVVSTSNPILSDFDQRPILPDTSNASGGAALLDLPGGQYSNDDSATWEVQFMTAGRYQFVPRISVFESGVTPSNYGNEDSFFLPPTWNKNSSTDWIGHVGEHYNGENPDIELTDPGFALDPLGWLTDDGSEVYTEEGDNVFDGRYEILDWGIKSAGELNFDANLGSPNPLRDGNFVWYEKPMMNNYGPTPGNAGWIDDFGFRATYIVTEEQVGEVLTFEIGTRETYAVLDGFAFIESPDNDLLDEFTQEQVDAILPPDVPEVVDGKNFLERQRGTAPGSLADWQSNFGNTANLPAATAVPEPATWLLLITMGMAALRVRIA